MRKSCLHCKLLDTQPYTLIEGDLFEDRVGAQYPFEVTGVDFIGPLDSIKGAKKKPSICIFSCPFYWTTALHAVPDQTYESFLRAFQKFKNTCDITPVLVRSDNDTTFQSAANQEKINQACFETQWEFNPVRAGWWGAISERLIRMVKEKMARCYHRQKFIPHSSI